MSLSFKSVAVAGAILLATVGGSFAATIDGNTPVKAGPHKWEDTVQWAFDGQDVKILKCKGAYCYVKISGPDGWVRYNVLDFGGYDDDDFYPGPGFGTQFCIEGKNAQFCLGAQY